MPKGYSIQNSFSSGEISPLAHGRTDSDLYRSGCEVLENMISDSHGPVRSRNGFEFLTQFAITNNAVIHVTQVTANLPYALVFTFGKMRIYSPEGKVWISNRVDNPRFHKGTTPWIISQFGRDSVIEAEKDNLVISTGLTRTTIEQQITGITLPTEDNRLKIHMTTGGKNYRLLLGTTQGAGDLLTALVSDELFVYDFPAAPIFPAPFWLTIEFDSVAEQTGVGTFKLHYTEIAYVAAGGSGPYEFATAYDAQQLTELRFIETPDGSAIYVLHPTFGPTKVTYDVVTEVWAYAAVTFTAPPTEWAADNYPSMGVIHQNRLWLGATRNQGATMWASKSNSFEDFTTGANDDDSFNFTLQNNDQIMWALATKDLVLGASHSEIIVTSTGGVITQSDIQLQQQSAYGSAPQQALLLGDQIIYISLDRRKLRVIQYEFRADNWLSTDLTFPSEHVSMGEIIGLSWQQDPDNLLWATLRDGTSVSLTYDRSNNIYGWHRHNTDGTILFMAAGNHIGRSIIFSAIKRFSTTLNIEVLGDRQSVDSWVEQSVRFSTAVFSGFEHLAGETVQVFADDAARIDAGGVSELVLQDDIVVSGGGTITLIAAAYRMVAGLPFTPKFKSLPFDAGSIGNGNTGRTHNKRWSKLFVELNESARPVINGSRPPTRTAPTPMDTTEPLKTEIVQVSLLGINKEAQISIEQDLPFPLVVISIFGEISQDNL